MSGSALIGHPPNNQDDWFIIRGTARLFGIPDEMLDPAKGFPSPVQRPPNFHYASRGPSIAASSAVTMFLIILITGTRLGLRFFRRDLRIGYDDYLIVPAALLCIAVLAIITSLVTHGGAGKHLYDLTYQEFNWLAGVNHLLANINDKANRIAVPQGSLMTIPIFWMAAGMIKLSIIFFNRRLTGLTSHRWMIVHYVFLATVLSFMIAALFTELFQCTGPVDLKFSLLARGRHATLDKCIDGNKLGYGLAIVHSFLDFCLLSIPLIVLYQMNLTLSKKIRLGFLFSVGLVSCIGSVMRQIVQTQTLTNPDLSWVYYDEHPWIIVDLFFGITAASLPVLNSLIPKRWRTSGNRTPQLNHFSIFNSKSGARQSVRLESGDNAQRPDGTALDEGDYAGRLSEVEKDSFHQKTEKRWDDAFVGVQQPDAAQTIDTGVGSKRSDDTLV